MGRSQLSLIRHPGGNSAPLIERAQAFLRSLHEHGQSELEREQTYEGMMEVTFAFWMARCGHPNARLDAIRRKYILSILRQSKGDLNLCLYCVDGARRDPYVMGTHPKAPRRADGVQQLFRDLATVEEHAERCPKFQRGEKHPLLTKYEQIGGNDNAG